jgi:glutaredoxin
MALKRHFTDKEKFGLTQDEIKMAEKYLRKNKTAGAVPEAEAVKLYEMYLVGCSFQEMSVQFPQYTVPQIILTCALRGWAHDREKMNGTLRDRVQAKVVKSIIEQVDFLTTMLSVVNAEHMESMRKYIEDPKNNKAPNIRVQNIKDYKETVETLQKLVAGAQGTNKKSSPMYETLSHTPSSQKQIKKDDDDEFNPAMLIASKVDNV